MLVKKRGQIRPIQIIAFGFLCMIAVGTFLLTLPISARSGSWTPIGDAAFTAVSSSCVTGLIVHDTYTYWSIFGQIVILLMIQIGGLGFMTVATLFSIIMRRKIGLKERGLLRESVNVDHIGGVVRLTKKVIYGTLIIEGSGAVLLAIRFVPQMGVLTGIYNAVFHSVSAFCNAGFDLMGRYGEYNSLCRYQDDVLVNVTVMLLIIIGGIGFIVWSDLVENKWHFKKYQVHTKIVLTTSAVLVFGGALMFYFMESNNLLKDSSFKESVLSSLFQSVTTRTAGFNTMDISSLSEGSQLLTIILMFIGGSPGSTAGGIKTTTMVVMFLSLLSSLKNTQEINVFKRRLEADAVRKAVSVFITNISLAILGAMIICAVQNIDIVNVFIETFSSIGTVGMSTGITRDLNTLSRVVVCVLMYCGRVGSLSFAMSFASTKTSAVMLPETKISIG